MIEKKIVASVQVVAEWDAEAGLWVAHSDDVPGLTAEHADLKALEAMLVELVPILLVENDMLPPPTDGMREIPMHIAAQAVAKAKIRVPA